MTNLKTPPDYDYIFTGLGCAAISLLMRLIKEGLLVNKKVLIIDYASKKENDRTWCFWEKQEGFFEHLVCHKWDSLLFHYDEETIALNIEPYSYKMLRGIDLYNHALEIIAQHKNIEVLKTKVESIENNNGLAWAFTNLGNYSASYLFNSILFEKGITPEKHEYNLIQHFKGWLIETETEIFNPNQATFMDFRVGQEKDTTFVYVLPTTTNRALVEYTFFNTTLLEDKEYDLLLDEYLRKHWGLKEWKIVEVERGKIPMTNKSFKQFDDKIINIGTAGGWTKPSSGFTFQFIQKYTQAITNKLINNQPPYISQNWLSNRFLIYDATLLNILYKHKMGGKEIFQLLFSKRPTPQIFRFLDNESNLFEEIAIMASVPMKVFLPVALQEMVRFVGKRD